MRQNAEPVTVFETTNPAVLAFVKSLLEEANIPYYAAGETLYQLAVGTMFVRIEVSAEDAANARALLSDVDAEPPDGSQGDR